MRTGKTGLDYFPFDVDFFEDEKIEFITAKYGILGENVIIKLLCRIYRNGYFLPWGEDECLLFAKRAGRDITPELVMGVVDELLKRNFFSKTHYEKFKVLTSNGIQKRFFEATARRKHASVREELLIVDIESLNVNIIAYNESKSTQRRGEERRKKGEERKGEGHFVNISLNEDEKRKLISRFGEVDAKARIERLSSYMASTGKKYKSHYATILVWAQKDSEATNASSRDPTLDRCLVCGKVTGDLIDFKYCSFECRDSKGTTCQG